MTIKQSRASYRAAWMAWHQAKHIRSAMARLSYNRNVGAIKRWYDECRVMFKRAERAHRRVAHGYA
jgi:hypothetical protein